MMIIKNQVKTKSITQGGIVFNFLTSGDLYDISYQDKQINLLKGNAIDGSLTNIYLRVYDGKQMKWTRLIGKHSRSVFMIHQQEAYYEGLFEDVQYQVRLILDQFTWQWHISLMSQTEKEVDLMYGQDIAIQSKASVLSSEPYTVQYIDYKAFFHQDGNILCARQNQGTPQFIQIGTHQKNVGYTTDGFQFFGLSYKETNIPEALLKDNLPSSIYQYEFAYFALQSEKIKVNQLKSTYDFYGYYEPHHEEAITTYKNIKRLTFDERPFINTSKHQHAILSTTQQLNGIKVDKKIIENLYSFMEHVEIEDDQLLSFFTKNNHHVVLQQKELMVERPHGHLMVHGDLLHVSDQVMATTNFMYGLFNSHVVLGNTSFNKFLGDSRNPLNVQKISGQRIYLKIHGKYFILGLPSYYEMGATITKWVYLLDDDDEITITTAVHMHENEETLTISSKKNLLYDMIIVSQIVMGTNEYLYDISYEINENQLIFKAPQSSMMFDKYQHLTYRLTSHQAFEILDEMKTFSTEDPMGMLLMHYKNVSDVRVDTQASIDSQLKALSMADVEHMDEIGTLYIQSILKYLDVKHPRFESNFRKLNQLSFWYTHNALVHYASPHGLEQYNGAAWGTRDVCQGPVELFMAAQRFDIVREIILKVYKRQFIENGDFPQWYMFDRYYTIQAHESHGDIIVWPLRTLAYYLKATEDVSILDEMIPYMSKNHHQFTEHVSLLEHVKKQVEAIQSSFIKNTHLPKYGGGDWDDTLQPANHDLTEKMVSGWTVALLYETLHLFAHEIQTYDKALSNDYLSLSQSIKKDYENYLIVDGIPAGFVIFNDKLEYLLHPRDEKTGLKYRLLPLTRAMISNLMKIEQKDLYVEIINQHLKHPDGVRLMNTTVAYHGGLKTYFQRAETAANFGREIGLQYVHAHIRYIEAMASIGHKDDAYKGLFEINPILIKKAVPNALTRQSNMYFSSSDAQFNDRYEAKSNFHLLKQGQIPVKGGWRLYSSGPGIYINQFITRIYGIRIEHGDLVIDPIIPDKQDGLMIHYQYLGIPLVVRVHKGEQEPLFMGKTFEYQRLDNPYRKGGIKVSQELLITQGYLDFDVWI